MKILKKTIIPKKSKNLEKSKKNQKKSKKSIIPKIIQNKILLFFK
jgi:hypothetical protein